MVCEDFSAFVSNLAGPFFRGGITSCCLSRRLVASQRLESLGFILLRYALYELYLRLSSSHLTLLVSWLSLRLTAGFLVFCQILLALCFCFIIFWIEVGRESAGEWLMVLLFLVIAWLIEFFIVSVKYSILVLMSSGFLYCLVQFRFVFS